MCASGELANIVFLNLRGDIIQVPFKSDLMVYFILCSLAMYRLQTNTDSTQSALIIVKCINYS